MIIGEIFDGRYKILDVIGRGGMSIVYLAENIKLGTLWAIKEIQCKGTKQIDFLAEPNMLKKLNHPALPHIFDIIERENEIYIIVNYIEGKSLLALLQEESKFSEERVIDWAKQLCEVLIYLHSQTPHPIIYRDMKPSNIILSSDGNISLIDFGIAREYKPESENDTVYIGTKGYAAPEQYGLGQTNKTTDIYSLGITLYHLLTGKNPNTPPYDIKPVRSLVPELSYEIEKIISKCVHINSTDRYQEVEEVLQAILDIPKTYIKNHYQNKTYLKSKESLLPITEYRSFKRVVVLVPENCEFACEFAYVISRQTKLKILIIEMNNKVFATDIYLPLKKSEKHGDEAENFERIFCTKLCENDQLDNMDSSVFKKCSSAENLYVLELHFGEVNDKCEQIRKIIEYSYRHYDLTLLVTNNENCEISKIAVLHSDLILAAAAANTDVLRNYEEYQEYVTKGLGVAKDCFKYIAYEYKKGISISPNLLKKIFGKESFLGCVTYFSEREKCRNIRTYFCEDYFKLIKDEYISFIEAIGIVEKKPSKNLLFDYFCKKDINNA